MANPRHKAARKPKGGDDTRTAILRLRLATDEMARLEKAAGLAGLGVSTWVRYVALKACEDRHTQAPKARIEADRFGAGGERRYTPPEETAT